MQYINTDALVETDWLAARLDAPELAVLDASWYVPPSPRDPRAEFAAAHIPGARYFDIDDVADASSDLPHMLPSGPVFAAKVGALGIANDAHVVVYDAQGAVTAPRVWWMFRAMGHARVSVLNGGLPKWRSEGRPLTDATPEITSARYRAAPDPSLVKTSDDVLKSLENKEFRILDARSAGRFHGREPELRPGLRSGHIPGAVSLHYERLFDPERRTFKDADSLAALFEAAGVRAGERVVTSCGSGVTACILALGLHLVGHADWAVYDGSWTEWGSRRDTPVEV